MYWRLREADIPTPSGMSSAPPSAFAKASRASWKLSSPLADAARLDTPPPPAGCATPSPPPCPPPAQPPLPPSLPARPGSASASLPPLPAGRSPPEGSPPLTGGSAPSYLGLASLAACRAALRCGKKAVGWGLGWGSVFSRSWRGLVPGGPPPGCTPGAPHRTSVPHWACLVQDTALYTYPSSLSGALPPGCVSDTASQATKERTPGDIDCFLQGA